MLPDIVRKRIETAAAERGVDAAVALAEAERLMGGGSTDTATPDSESGDTSSETLSDARPIFERLLIGVLPFVTVRELRTIWLKLDGPFPDDELPCGDFLVKHGGAGAAAAPSGAPPAAEGDS